MTTLMMIRRKVRYQHRVLKRSLAALEQIQNESLAHFHSDPEKEAMQDERLRLPFVFVGFVGVAAASVKEALQDLEQIKDATHDDARRLFETLLEEDA